MQNSQNSRNQDTAAYSLLHKQMLADKAASPNPEKFLSSHPELSKYYIGVDVGSGSARACCIDATGNILALSEKVINKEVLETNHVTQSSNEIWDAIRHCVKLCV